MKLDSLLQPEKLAELSVQDRIDVICDAFERNFESTGPQDLASYLSCCTAAEQRRLLVELLLVDCEIRTRIGEPPLWDEYGAPIRNSPAKLNRPGFDRSMKPSHPRSTARPIAAFDESPSSNC